MRALKPWVGPLLAVLLLLQWGGAAASCLGMMAWSPDQVICHAPPDGAGAQSSVPGAPGQPDTMAACAACAPLPASLLPVLPELPPPAPARHPARRPAAGGDGGAGAAGAPPATAEGATPVLIDPLPFPLDQDHTP